MDINLVKRTIEEILEILDVSYEIEVFFDENIGTTSFNITTKDPQILLGHEGTHLMALSHIIKRITDKSGPTKEQSTFILDVNNYQRKKTEELKNKAIMLAERARYLKSNVEMSPATPYERMIIHSIFTKFNDIKTESIGEGKNRRIVIKYIALEK